MNLPEESIDDYIAHCCHDDRLDRDLLAAIADANRRWGAHTGLGHAQAIAEWLALTPIERAAALPQLRKVVLTDKDTLKIYAGQTKAEPHYEAHAGRLAVLISELRIETGNVRAHVTVSYQSEPLMGFLVPVEMREWYERRGERIEGHAVYGQFRPLSR